MDMFIVIVCFFFAIIYSVASLMTYLQNGIINTPIWVAVIIFLFCGFSALSINKKVENKESHNNVVTTNSSPRTWTIGGDCSQVSMNLVTNNGTTNMIVTMLSEKTNNYVNANNIKMTIIDKRTIKLETEMR